MDARRNPTGGDRETAYLGGIVIVFGLIIILMLLSGCAAPAAARLIDSEQPFTLSLDEGTHWVYWRMDGGAEPALRSPLDTLDIWVEEILAPPRNPILIEPLLNRPERVPAVPPGAGFYLPAAAPSDSADLIETITVAVTGPVFRIAARGRTSQGKYPHFVANSTAGLLDLTGWVWRWPQDPVPVYRRYNRAADLIVPADDSPIGGWCTDDSGWYVTGRDRPMEVPAGTFRCIEISYHFHTRSGSEPDFPVYREYWAPQVGLIAWDDRRPDGDGSWVLAAFDPGSPATAEPPDRHHR